jgi:hypothetical protein
MVDFPMELYMSRINIKNMMEMYIINFHSIKVQVFLYSGYEMIYSKNSSADEDYLDLKDSLVFFRMCNYQ